MNADRYPQKLAKLIGDLSTLIEHTRTTESEVTASCTKRTSGSDRRRETQLGELDDQTAARLEEHVRQHEQAVRSLEQQRQDRLDHATNQFEQRKEDIEDEAKLMRTQARKGLQEQEWLAESVYEATGSEPRKRLQLTTKELELAGRRLSEQRTRAGDFRRRCRMQDCTLDGTLPAPSTDADPEVSLQALRDDLDELEKSLKRMHALIVPRIFIGPVPFVIMLLAGILSWGGGFFTFMVSDDGNMEDHMISGIWPALGGVVLAMIILWFIRRISVRRFQNFDEDFTEQAAKIDLVMIDIKDVADQQCAMQEQAILDRRDREIRDARDSFAPKLEQVSPRRERRHEKLEENYRDLLEKIEERHAEKCLEEAEHDRTEHARLERESTDRRAEIELNWEQETHTARSERDETMKTLAERWNSGTAAFADAVEGINADLAASGAAPWSESDWNDWSSPTAGPFNGFVPYGAFDLDVNALGDGLPSKEHFSWPMDATLSLPAMLDLPRAGSLFVEFSDQGRDEAVETLQNTMLRLLMSLPPGKIRFTVIDPVGLGQNFAGFMHLADHDELPIIEKIWTEPRHIEQQLNDLTEHMENVIQTYLRNEYDTIDEYNAAAGEIAEPYHFLVMADLPANLTENAGQRLTSIAQTGARCGVYTLMACDTRQSFPRDVHRKDLAEGSTLLEWKTGRIRSADPALVDIPLATEAPPPERLLTSLVQAAGRAAEQSHRVEVPFPVITPPDEQHWTLSTAKDLRVSIGQSGATRQQQLVLGRGTSQHALVAGKTGSGKSTLLHVLITNLALWYSPDEIQFYLVDFKKGVEFKTYADRGLPHAKVIAIESDREFGLSVLQRIDQELRERGELYRDLGVQDIAGCREKYDQPMPRIMLVVDEFQELFVDDDKVSQEASLLLDRLVRQGRAFGIHALLGSQTLDGAYSLARSTLGQMGVRIALQCTEADSYLILSEENAAARLLARPGEAIYNDAGGKIEGNNPFQICWLDDSVRDDNLETVRMLAERDGSPRTEPPFIFEGNVPADLQRCRQLLQAIHDGPPASTPQTLEGWLGDAIAIKDPTTANFQLHSGCNLLLVGQREETVTAMMEALMLSLAAQAPADGLEFHVLDALPADAPFHGRLMELGSRLPHEVSGGTHKHTTETMDHLGSILAARRNADSADGPRIVLFVNGLHRIRDLRRPEDDFSFSTPDPDAPAKPDAIFAELVKDGPAHGIHVVAWSDTLNNLNRTLDRNCQREFEMRVLFQMSANDSSHLIDSPAASMLGLQRALFNCEDSGIQEKFRPWALPEQVWLSEITAGI